MLCGANGHYRMDEIEENPGSAFWRNLEYDPSFFDDAHAKHFVVHPQSLLECALESCGNYPANRLAPPAISAPRYNNEMQSPQPLNAANLATQAARA